MAALFEGNLVFVTAAYAAAAVVLVGLLWASLAERRARRRQLAALETEDGAS